MDWSESPDVERIPGKVSGTWLVKGMRLPVDAILLHAHEYTREEIATELYQGICPETVRRILAFTEALPSAAA